MVGLTQGTDEVNTSFSIPVHHRNTLLTIGYNRSKNTVIEEPLDDLDVESRLTSVRIALNHPVYKTLQRRVDLGLTLETQKSETSLLGIPFSFSEGYDDGESRVSALRFTQSFQDRSISHAFVFRSTLNFGLDILDATIHSDGRTDGEFVTWLGQFQYAHRFEEKLGQIIFRGDAQISDDNLLSMEQFSLGGATTIRGYRENEIVRDNGIVLSMEWRVPVWEILPSKKWGGKYRWLLLLIMALAGINQMVPMKKVCLQQVSACCGQALK
jgi:hemolysin activation/secretion protein